MSSTIPPIPPQGTPPDWRDVFEFIRDENQKDREHLHKTFNLVVKGTTIIFGLVLAAFFFMTYKSLSEAKAGVKNDVQTRLNEEFSTPEIKKLVSDAAREATRKDLSGIIHEAAAEEVLKARPRFEQIIEKEIQGLRAGLQKRVFTPSQAKAIEAAVKPHISELGTLFQTNQPFRFRIRFSSSDGDAAVYAKSLAEAMLAKSFPAGWESSNPGEVVSPGFTLCVDSSISESNELLQLIRSVLSAGKIYPRFLKSNQNSCKDSVVLEIGSLSTQ